MEAINRRSFLTGTAAAGLGVAAMGLGVSAAYADEAAEEEVAEEEAAEEEVAEEAEEEASEESTTYEPSEVVECDLCVVGAGISGMGACIEAVDQGLSVVLLEKETAVGGTLPGTEGLFGLNSQLQIEQGTELPTVPEIVKEELEYTNYRTDPLLWNEVISNSGDDIDWLSDLGINFETVDNYLDQSAYNTFHWWEGENGTATVETMGNAITEAGVDVRVSTPAVDLKIEDGAVTGVYAEDADGNIIEVDAKAVLLATGGMANDIELTAEKTGLKLDTAQSLYPINEVGDGLNMAISAGAKETSVSIQNVWSVEGFASDDPITVGGCTQPVLLYVNEEGERYLDETLCKEKFYALLTNALLTQKQGYCIINQALVDQMETEGCIIGIAQVKAGDLLEGFNDELEEAVAAENPTVWKGETIEELAENMGIDPDTLSATLSRYNEMCANGEDEDFGKDPEYLVAMEEGPYYAITPVVCIFQTMGGIGVNRDMQVVDDDDEPIAGLYSSGMASCGLYKETYCYQVSGGSNCYCLYTGRKAAQTIAASLA